MHPDLRAAARLASDGQLRAQGVCALAHDAHPERLGRDFAGFEIAPIIFDDHFNGCRAAGQAQDDLAGVRMLGGVIQGFLGNPVKEDLHFR
jgi:hypothetical protein